MEDNDNNNSRSLIASFLIMTYIKIDIIWVTTHTCQSCCSLTDLLIFAVKTYHLTYRYLFTYQSWGLTERTRCKHVFAWMQMSQRQWFDSFSCSDEILYQKSKSFTDNLRFSIVFKLNFQLKVFDYQWKFRIFELLDNCHRRDRTWRTWKSWITNQKSKISTDNPRLSIVFKYRNTLNWKSSITSESLGFWIIE